MADQIFWGHGFKLQQIPLIAIQVFKHRNGAIRFMARGFKKPYTGIGHAVMVTGKIIGIKEKANPPAGLIPNDAGLTLAFGLGK